MASSERDNRERLQELLRELFQFDTADLDFGVYRILNQRRDEIEAFIEEDLLDTVEESLESVADAKREEIEAELERKRTALNQEWDDDIFNADGSLKEQYASLGQSAIDEYQELQEARENAAVAEETEARIFSDLYRFFSRYYDDGDFHTKRRISARDAKYAVPYNGEETHFHWANHDQYYVKTGEHFTDYRFDAEPYTVEFRLEEADVPQDNVKGDSRYFVLGRGDPIAADADEHRVTIRFQYRRITDTEADEYVEDYNDATGDDRSSFAHMTPEMRCDALQGRILAAVENGEIERVLTATGDEDDTPTELKKHLTRYVTENSMDYFVHKDLETFLERELEFFLQNEVLDVDDLLATEDGESPALVRARTVKQIAERIITFLAQIEDFQKRLFEKKKFVVQTDYMVTLDRVPDRLYTTILDNEAQLDQWREVYNTAEWDEDLTWRGEFDATFLDNHPYAMIDTGLFDEAFKLDLLSAFEDIEAATDGVLVKGENFQALNLLLEKYRNEVDCTYIDPPYNTGKGDFAYKDHYQHSSWLSMMSDRVLITKELMKDGAPLFTTLDDNEQSNYRQLMNGIFGKTNFAGNIVWQKRISPDDRATLGAAHDNIPTYTTNIDEFGEILGRLPLTEDRKSSYTNPDDDPRGRWASVDITGQEGHATPDQFYEIETPSGVTYSPPNGRWLKKHSKN